MEEKNGFHKPENQFPPAGIWLFLKNWISRFPQTESNLYIKEHYFS